MFRVNNRNIKTRYEICSKLTIKTPEQRQWRRPGVFVIKFEYISSILLLTFNRQMSARFYGINLVNVEWMRPKPQ